MTLTSVCIIQPCNQCADEGILLLQQDSLWKWHLTPDHVTSSKVPLNEQSAAHACTDHILKMLEVLTHRLCWSGWSDPIYLFALMWYNLRYDLSHFHTCSYTSDKYMIYDGHGWGHQIGIICLFASTRHPALLEETDQTADVHNITVHKQTSSEQIAMWFCRAERFLHWLQSCKGSEDSSCCSSYSSQFLRWPLPYGTER